MTIKETIAASLLAFTVLLVPAECGPDSGFQPAPEEPWKYPKEPLPDYDPKKPNQPHRPPSHPGPKKPQPKPVDCPEKGSLRPQCW